MSYGKLPIGTDFRITLDKTQDDAGNYLNNGTCTYELLDKDGGTVAGGSVPYETASDGKYTLVVNAIASLEQHTVYTLYVTFAGQDGEDLVKTMDLVAVYL